MFTPLLAFSWPGPFEMMMIAGIGLLIFGRRLPEVGRSIGKTIVEFKRGMREIEDETLNDDRPQPKLEQPRSDQARSDQAVSDQPQVRESADHQ